MCLLIELFKNNSDKYGEDVLSHLHPILKRCMFKNGDWDMLRSKKDHSEGSPKE